MTKQIFYDNCDLLSDNIPQDKEPADVIREYLRVCEDGVTESGKDDFDLMDMLEDAAEKLEPDNPAALAAIQAAANILWRSLKD